MEKVRSRKFLIASAIAVFTAFGPLLYKWAGVSETVTLAALGVLGGIAVGYGVINVKDAKNKLMASIPQSEDTKVEVTTEVKAG